MWTQIVRNSEEDDAVASVDDDVIEDSEEEDGDDYNGDEDDQNIICRIVESWPQLWRDQFQDQLKQKIRFQLLQKEQSHNRVFDDAAELSMNRKVSFFVIFLLWYSWTLLKKIEIHTN